MGANRIELSGRLLAEPVVRVTPAGTPVVRILVECGTAERQLALPVVMAGEHGRTVAAGLRSGAAVEVSGRLQAVAANDSQGGGVEVVADRIERRS